MAAYCVTELHWAPSVYAEMDTRERGFVIASIMDKAESMKKVK